MQATSIQEVLLCLRTIIQNAIQSKDRCGYFAALYYKMTVAIQQGIEAGFFEDGDRMERLDVAFANRYLAAHAAYQQGAPLSFSWQTAFSATAEGPHIVLQHLLLGINAHINLDLGIAAAAISNRENIAALQVDFMRVNQTIGSLFAEVQDSLSRIAFPMHFIKLVDPDRMHAVLDFSIGKARDVAWSNALLLVAAGAPALPALISTTDQLVVKVAERILHPGTLMRSLLAWIHWCESKDIPANIRFLTTEQD